jgi:hypothetical protein
MTSTHAIAETTSLPALWVSDAIEGRMAEVIYRQHGAKESQQNKLDIWPETF